MADATGIEWTESTWNPTTGCSKVSAGCANCYADALSSRLRAMGVAKYAAGFEFAQHDSEADRPLRWRRPRRIFVNSMSDLFHERADDAFVGRCFDTMIRARWHTYQVLTKRPARMAEFAARFEALCGFRVPPHVWLGTSVEDGRAAGRIDELRRVRCHVRFVSFEPLIGEIPRATDLRGIDWAIIGGESGPRRRPVSPEWVDSLIGMCRRDGAAVFFKQWGGPRPHSGGRLVHGAEYSEYPAVPEAPPAEKRAMESYIGAPGRAAPDASLVAAS